MSEVHRMEFEIKYLPECFQWRTLEKGEIPFFGAGEDKLGPKGLSHPRFVFH